MQIPKSESKKFSILCTFKGWAVHISSTVRVRASSSNRVHYVHDCHMYTITIDVSVGILKLVFLFEPMNA